MKRSHGNIPTRDCQEQREQRDEFPTEHIVNVVTAQ
jgi:hypothetical protein